MDFFEHQERARRHTWMLMLLYCLAVGGLVFAVNGAALVVFGRFTANCPDSPIGGLCRDFVLWQPRLYGPVTLGVLGIIASGTLYKSYQLRSGGGAYVARSLGGVPISPDTRDVGCKRLANVVEEMAIAAGIPVPQVFVLEEEQGINAFAAGFSPTTAVVGVSRGCIDTLTRDELQGVIAHEFSHILNGDMLLNIRLMGILNGILCVALFGLLLMRTREYSRSASEEKQGNWIVMFGFFLYGLGYLGVFFSKVIKAAVSRQREFLADASAVQFTRNPAGIGGALRKIMAGDQGTRIKHVGAEEMSHLFFANGLRQRWFSVFATHPSLQERIRRVEGVSALDLAPSEAETIREHGGNKVDSLVSGIRTQGFTDLVGTISARAVASAPGLLETIPNDLRAACRSSETVRPVIAGLFLFSEGTVLQKQERILQAAGFGADGCEQALAAQQLLEQLQPGERSIVLELAAPALRSQTAGERMDFCQTLRSLVSELPQASLYHYALFSVIAALVAAPSNRGMRSATAEQSLEAARVLISAISVVGSTERREQDSAFEAARQEWPALEGLIPREACSLPLVEGAMRILDNSASEVQRILIRAMAAAAATDGVLTSEEVELVRISCLAFGCPIPAQF